MKRVMIIGCPGGGKSTFARALREITGLPLYYLDMMNWNADRTTVPKEVFRERLRTVLEQDAWIIDGNYGSTMELRLQRCDTVFFLDYPVELCLEGALSRRGQIRPDMPWTEAPGDDVDAEFIEFIRDFHKVSRPKILRLLEQYAHRNIVVFHGRSEAEDCLNGLRK